MAEKVKVMIRLRPMNGTEKADNRGRIVQMNCDIGQISVQDPSNPDDEAKSFTFDQVFDSDSSQQHVFELSAVPLITNAIKGYNATIFAYGQTGTGKTHSMEGKENPPEMRGIIPRTFGCIFDKVASEVSAETQMLVRASYLEIYNEEVRDLLSNTPHSKLDLKESKEKGVYVKDLTQVQVAGKSEIEKVMQKGGGNRAVSGTNMNAESSRSHAIFTVIVEVCTTVAGKDAKKGSSQMRMGKLNLVDLAGSERQGKTGATGDRLKEAQKINLSLSALGNVINALVDGGGHVPFRDSKLTRLLQDSLGGNTKTVMLVAVGPADWNFDETISTLRYANRAKNIKNKPKINEDPKDAMLREFQEEIAKLKGMLSQSGSSIATLATEQQGVLTQLQELTQQSVQSEQTVEKRVITQQQVVVDDSALAEIRDKANKEKTAASAEVKKAEAEASKMQKELDSKRQALEAEQQKQQDLELRLQSMQKNLLVGGRVVDEVIAEQEEQLELKRQQMDDAAKQEKELRQQQQEAEDLTLEWQEKFSSLEDENDKKTQRLERLTRKTKAAQQEVFDLEHEFQVERETLLDTIRDLSKQMRLQKLCIDSIIPAADFGRIESKALVWDESLSTWSLLQEQYAGNAARERKPISKAMTQRSASRGGSGSRQGSGKTRQGGSAGTHKPPTGRKVTSGGAAPVQDAAGALVIGVGHPFGDFPWGDPYQMYASDKGGDDSKSNTPLNMSMTMSSKSNRSGSARRSARPKTATKVINSKKNDMIADINAMLAAPAPGTTGGSGNAGNFPEARGLVASRGGARGGSASRTNTPTPLEELLDQSIS